MDVETLDIEAVKVITPRRFEDDRGYFTETYNQRQFDEKVTPLTFVQDNASFSKHQYTVRGLHYQSPPFAQDKLVRVLKGSILDVVVDVRKGSPTYGQSVSAELSAENGKQLLCPIGFLHGFMTLESDTLVAYKVTNFYDGASDGGVFWASPDLKLPWPVGPEAAHLSEKDLKAPTFGTFETPFT
ncbi:MAG: dTDP-4-dehydrorhamnose 3,5-epimerase [Pseudomonadota bacterium]